MSQKHPNSALSVVTGSTAGIDYRSLTQTLEFNSGDTEMCADIDILDDSEVEMTEVFTVNLQSITGEGIINAPAFVDILDSDEGQRTRL